MVKLLFLNEIEQVGSGAGGRVGSGVAEPEIAAKAFWTRFASQKSGSVELNAGALTLLFLKEVKQVGSGGGGRAGSGVAEPEIAAKTLKQIVAQKIIWALWELNPLEAEGIRIGT